MQNYILNCLRTLLDQLLLWRSPQFPSFNTLQLYHLVFPGGSVQETQVRSLEKEMATHSSVLAWEIPWTEEPGRATVHGVVRVGHDWVIKPPPPRVAESLFELSVSTSSVCLNAFKIGRWGRASCALYPQGGLYKSLSSLRGVRGAAPRALSAAAFCQRSVDWTNTLRA